MKIGFTLLPQPGKYNPDLMLTFEKGKLEAFSFIERKGYIYWEGIG